MSSWKKINEAIVFSNKWLRIEKVRFELPTKKQSDYYFVRGNPVAAVLGITSNKKVVLVRQYRPAIGKYMLDIPGGGVEDGEDVKKAAVREFMEETGYGLKNVKKLTKFYYDSGKSSKYSTIFVGQVIAKRISPKKDGTELVEVQEIPYDELLDKIRKDKVEETTLRIAICSLESSSFKVKYI